MFGWEPDFLQKVDEVFQEEMDIEDKQHTRQKIYDVAEHMLSSFMEIAVISIYIALGNTITLQKLALTQWGLSSIRGQIDQTQFLYKLYFDVMESMKKLWEFYCAPECQTGLIERKKAENEDLSASEDISKDSDEDPDAFAITIKGNYSYGITPKLDQADKDKIRDKIKKKEYEQKTKDMNKARKFIFDMMRDEKYKPQIPFRERTLETIISLKDLDIKIKKGSFTVIVGATGSGKSTLLNAMIGELIYLPEAAIKEVGSQMRPIKDGEMRYLEDSLLELDLTGKSPITISGSSSYCEQQPWIQNGKLRDNVLFGLEFEKKRYVETIMAC